MVYGRLGASFAITGLVSGLLCATSANAVGIEHSGLTSLNGNMVVSGHMTTPKGPVAGAQVVLYAWPANKVLSELRPGQRIPARVVGSSITTASGSYAIRITSPSALSSAMAPDGIVNLEVDAMSGNTFGSYNFPRRVVETSHGAVLTEISGRTAQATAAETADIRALPVRAQAPGACGWVKLRTFKPSWTIVGGTYSITKYSTESFRYSVHQSSSLGAGLSASGKPGSFSQNGTTGVSASSSESYRPRGGNVSVLYETQFINAEWALSCGHGFISYQTKPVEFAGGARSVSTRAPKAKYCVYQEAGSTFTKDSTSAYSFSAGFSIPVLNLTLSAQTGYDSGASVSYHFTRAGHLCGTNAYPGQTPKRLLARG